MASPPHPPESVPTSDKVVHHPDARPAPLDAQHADPVAKQQRVLLAVEHHPPLPASQRVRLIGIVHRLEVVPAVFLDGEALIRQEHVHPHRSA